MAATEKILVLDFGGQYNQLIARRVRDQHVYCDILPYTTPIDEIRAGGYSGIIFTGGPNSVYLDASPHYTPDILNLGIPVLGICYGAQLMAWMLGGTIEHAPNKATYRAGDRFERYGMAVRAHYMLKTVSSFPTLWMRKSGVEFLSARYLLVGGIIRALPAFIPEFLTPGFKRSMSLALTL